MAFLSRASVLVKLPQGSHPAPPLKILESVIAGFVPILLVPALVAPPARAHTPHHDVQQLEVSPGDPPARTLFAIVRGNLLRSIDGGSEWKRLVNGLDHRHVLSSLEVAPSASEVLYLASRGDGVFRSGDSGLSWLRVADGLPTRRIHVLAVSPGSSDEVLAAGVEGGLFRTSDGGRHWQRVMDSNRRITAIAFEAGESGSILAGDQTGCVDRSLDAGRSWEPFSAAESPDPVTALESPPAPSDGPLFATRGGRLYRAGDDAPSRPTRIADFGQPIVDLAASRDPAGGSILFALTARDGVFRSRDGGATWEGCHGGLSTDPQADEWERPNFSEIELSSGFPTGGAAFVAGFDGLFVSGEGGCSWTQLRTLSSKAITGLGVSPDHAEDGMVAVGTYLWGIYLSRDRGRTWTASHDGLAEGRPNGIARVFDVVFSPDYRADGTLFSATWWLLLRSTDRGDHWRKIEPAKAGGYTIAPSPDFAADDTVFLGTMQGRILQSTDGGDSFSLLTTLPRPVSSLGISPGFRSDRTVFAGVAGGVYRSRDAGRSWQATSLALESPEAALAGELPRWMRELDEQAAAVQLAVSPGFASDGELFAGTSEGLFRSRDRGSSWERVFPPDAAPSGIIEAVALSPDYREDRTVLISVRGRGLFKSVDGGQGFVEIAPELIQGNHLLANQVGFPLARSTPIEFSPAYGRDRTIFGFSEARVFRSEDGGETWEALEVPMPDYGLWTRARLLYLRLELSTRSRVAASLAAAGLTFLGLRRTRLPRMARTRRARFLIRSAAAIAAFAFAMICLSP